MTTIVRSALMSFGIVATLAAGLMASPAHADQNRDRDHRSRHDPYYGRTYYGHEPYYGSRPYYGRAFDHRYPGAVIVTPPHVGYPGPVLNDWQINRRLDRQGYNVIGPLYRTNGFIHARAVDDRGRHVRLTVSPVTGRIVDARYHR